MTSPSTSHYPWIIGQENEYTILVQLDEEQSEPHYSVKNLSFQTVKRVVLEEGTGQDCPNCPQGILAIENLEDVYGDLFIPVSLHTYSGDPYGTGFESYAAFLNITGYPSGTVNRTNQVPVGAMTSDENGNATFTIYGTSLLVRLCSCRNGNKRRCKLRHRKG